MGCHRENLRIFSTRNWKCVVHNMCKQSCGTAAVRRRCMQPQAFSGNSRDWTAKGCKVPTPLLGGASAIDAPLHVVARAVTVCGLLISVSYWKIVLHGKKKSDYTWTLPYLEWHKRQDPLYLRAEARLSK